jgi:chromosome segregation ATPase
MTDVDDILREIEELRARRDELEASIPAHSTKPHHVMQIEDLEDRIELLERSLEGLP